MGTYCYAVLNVSNQKLKKINKTLGKLGYPNEIHNGVEFGAFTTDEMLAEDVRYLNEDPEGLKQCPGWTRPITKDTILNNWCFIKPKQFCCKFSGEKNLKLISIVLKWLWQNMELVNHAESSYYTMEEVYDYFDESYNLGLEFKQFVLSKKTKALTTKVEQLSNTAISLANQADEVYRELIRINQSLGVS